MSLKGRKFYIALQVYTKSRGWGIESFKILGVRKVRGLGNLCLGKEGNLHNGYVLKNLYGLHFFSFLISVVRQGF